ncbi:MAG TPA: acetyl-CoA carboxylase biotin carboxyl carrier protein [Caulobacteraceae bacterium]|jgi:acetyl-CoA carboxylase biotin carboxyl carrier protein|nr:acetyl-CoA carboxylase biotin carboxyl carrier protein [Caulobacteraceae bacterium]
MPDPKAPADPIDARLVRRLAAILNDTGLTEIEVERGDLRIKVARNLTVQAAAPQMYAAAPAPAAPAAGPAPAAQPQGMAEIEGDLVKSPMVGTVYLQPEPGAAPFARVGDNVSEGQTLLIIEAMKTMNPIPAPRAGRLLEMLVADGQPVEFGEPLAVIG